MAAVRSMKKYLSLLETRVEDAETTLSTQMPPDQEVKVNKVQVGLVRCRRLTVKENEALEEMSKFRRKGPS